MVIPSKSYKTNSLKNNGLIYKHKLSFSKASIKRTSRRINYIKPPNNYLSIGSNINIGLPGRDIRTNENQFEGFLFREHSTINIEESNKTNFAENAAKCEKIVKNNEKVYVFRDEMDSETRDTEIGKYQVDISGNNCNNVDNISNENGYKNYPIGSHNENPNVNEGCSRWNRNDCSQIDSQSYSKEHQNIDNFYYPINKCENCQNLKLQNDNAQSEMRKLRSDFEKLKEQNKLEREKFVGEIDYLKSNNASLQSKHNYLDSSKKNIFTKYRKKISENEKYRSENAIANRKYNEMNQLNENLKSQLINYESEIRKLRSEIRKFGSKSRKFGSESRKFGSESRKFGSESKKFGSESRKFGSESRKYKSKISKYKSIIIKYQSENESTKCKYIETDQLKLQNKIENLEKEINNLISENKLLIKFKSEHEKYRSENEKYRSENEKYRSENEKYRSENEKYRSENEKYRSENEKYKSENKLLIKFKIEHEKYRSENKLLNKFKMENENLKSQILKSVSKIRKSQSKNKRMKDKIPNLRKKFQSLDSQSVKSSSEHFNWNAEFPIGNDNSTIHDDDNLERDNLASNISSNNELPNNFGKEFISCPESTVIKSVLDEEEINEIGEKLIEEIRREIIFGIAKSSFYETWKPLGFANPKGYCYLNSVVQVLGSCEDFKMDIYRSKWISTEETNDSVFVEGLFNLIQAIRDCNRENLDKSLNIVQENITESSFGDDVYKCFMNLLTRVSNVVKTNINRPSDHFMRLPINLSEKAKANFERFKNRNPGFVFDNFYGQLTFQTVCTICDYVCNESFQLMKSLPLPVPPSL